MREVFQNEEYNFQALSPPLRACSRNFNEITTHSAVKSLFQKIAGKVKFLVFLAKEATQYIEDAPYILQLVGFTFKPH